MVSFFIGMRWRFSANSRPMQSFVHKRKNPAKAGLFPHQLEAD
jgi:hypothetical protein